MCPGTSWKSSVTAVWKRTWLDSLLLLCRLSILRGTRLSALFQPSSSFCNYCNRTCTHHFKNWPNLVVRHFTSQAGSSNRFCYFHFQMRHCLRQCQAEEVLYFGAWEKLVDSDRSPQGRFSRFYQSFPTLLIFLVLQPFDCLPVQRLDGWVMRRIPSVGLFSLSFVVWNDILLNCKGQGLDKRNWRLLHLLFRQSSHWLWSTNPCPLSASTTTVLT